MQTRLKIMDQPKSRWAELVRNKRAEFNETQQEFAARFGMSGQSIQQWEAQGNLPNPKNRYAMAKICGWTTDQLNQYLETGEVKALDAFDLEKVVQQLKGQKVEVVAELISKASNVLQTKVLG